MKRKYYILGLLATLCLLGTGYYAWTLYDAHRKQVAEWNEGAKAAFEEALWMEVNKRAEIPIYSYSSEEESTTTLKERIPDSVSVMTADGIRRYKIDRDKYDNSLIKETMKRGHLGILLEMYPLSIDTLLINWDSLLSSKSLPLHSQIRYVYTDLNLDNDTVFSVVEEQFSCLDSLTVKYLGFRCEHELVAFVVYPLGGDMSWCIFGGLILPWGLFVLLIVFYDSIERFFQQKFVKEKIVEKEVYVADVQIEKAKIFRLEDDSFFDSLAGTITKGDLSHTLPPQSALLLRLFLRKENHHLSMGEIEQELWKGQGTTAQLHKAIQRLRMELKKVSSDIVVKNLNGDYELKLPISSKILEKETTDED